MVTNDLNQDQRMHRICTTLTAIGYDVTLVGRAKKKSPTLLIQPFNQKRIPCFFQKGALFYAEYNLKLWWHLLINKQDIIYAVDTDTLLPSMLTKLFKNHKLIFDAHEYFTEVPELQHKLWTKKIWSTIEKISLAKVDLAITVNESLAALFSKNHRKTFHCIYNVPELNHSNNKPTKSNKPYILYQGVLNKGRGLEALIIAMKNVPSHQLLIAGEGDLSAELRVLVDANNLNEKVIFKGWQSPSELKNLTAGATLGINLLDGSSLNYYYSLANKFFDYMHADVPSVNMDFPEYRRIIDEYDIGYLLKELSVDQITSLLNDVLNDTMGLALKKQACLAAVQKYQWQHEAQKLQRMLQSL